MTEHTFGLLDDQVPEPPESLLWIDSLRWLLMVMDCDNPMLEMVATCYAGMLQGRRMSDEQTSLMQQIFSYTAYLHRKEDLNCQQPTEIEERISTLYWDTPRGSC